MEWQLENILGNVQFWTRRLLTYSETNSSTEVFVEATTQLVNCWARTGYCHLLNMLQEKENHSFANEDVDAVIRCFEQASLAVGGVRAKAEILEVLWRQIDEWFEVLKSPERLREAVFGKS